MGKIAWTAFAYVMMNSLAFGGNDNIYTLYRTSPVSGNSINRIHIATFDADEGGEYNRENCFVAADLFMNQPSVVVRYWCEKGRYKK
jgi:hypothetical protein